MTPVRTKGVATPRILTRGVTTKRIEAREVAESLGAQQVPVGRTSALGSGSFARLRAEIGAALRSTGGRPSLAGATRRVKIPIRDEDWERVEELRVLFEKVGVTVSAGQIGSVLLQWGLNEIATVRISEEIGPPESQRPLQRGTKVRA
jgi:hypothetical protein